MMATVLIVEDEGLLALYWKDIVEQELGVRAIIVPSIALAQEALIALVDFVLLDASSTGDGFALCEFHPRPADGFAAHAARGGRSTIAASSIS